MENKGLRAVAKLMLFMGKPSPNNFTSAIVVDNGSDFLRHVFDSSKHIEDFHILSEDYAQIDWTRNAEFELPVVNTNIFIAIFTTAEARLKLYSVMEKLGERLHYVDTDSLIFVDTVDQILMITYRKWVISSWVSSPMNWCVRMWNARKKIVQMNTTMYISHSF